VWLLPGSARIVEFEKIFESAATFKTGQWVGVFRGICNKLARDNNLDYVLIDCSPSSGVINKLAVMSADYILPPAMPDLGTVGSLHGMLTYVLPEWMAYRKDSMVPVTTKNFPYKDFVLPKLPPRLLPVIVVNFGAAKTSPNEIPSVIAKPSQWIRTIIVLMQMRADVMPQVDAATRKKVTATRPRVSASSLRHPSILTNPQLCRCSTS
jgi:hypothetical protein